MKYDIEEIRDALVDIVKTNLRAKLTEIEVEKADGIRLKMPSDGDIVGSMGDKVLNSNVFMLYNIADIETTNMRVTGSAAYNIKMFFMVAFTQDQNKNEDHEAKALRYSRAIQEVFLENATTMRGGKIEVKPYAPLDWAPNANSPYWKVGGVEVEFTTAT